MYAPGDPAASTPVESASALPSQASVDAVSAAPVAPPAAFPSAPEPHADTDIPADPALSSASSTPEPKSEPNAKPRGRRAAVSSSSRPASPKSRAGSSRSRAASPKSQTASSSSRASRASGSSRRSASSASSSRQPGPSRPRDPALVFAESLLIPPLPPPTPSAPPILPISDSLLLSAVAARKEDPEAIAARYNIRLDLFCDWLCSPVTADRLAALQRAKDSVEHQKHKLMLEGTMNTLAELHVASSGNEPAERRRAAYSLGRLCMSLMRPSPASKLISGMRAPSAFRSRGTFSSLSPHQRTTLRTQRAAPILDEPPVILPPPSTKPDPAATPAQTTIAILQRLQDNDNPSNGDGLRALHAHFNPMWQNRSGYEDADEFAKDDPILYQYLVGHHSAVLHPTHLERGWQGDEGPFTLAIQRFDFRDLDANPHTAEFQFSRPTENHPWLINHVSLDRPDQLDKLPRLSRPEHDPP